MTNEEIYILADIARLNAEVAGMQAENEMRKRQDKAPAYGESSFEEAISRNGLGHNQIIIRVQRINS